MTIALKVAAAVAVLFGLATVQSGAGVLLGRPAAVQAAGDFVPFVVWFNTLAGAAYVVAGGGLWFRRRWAVLLAWMIAAATLVTFAALLAHIGFGGAYETRTVAAMALRSGVWIAVALVAARALPRTA